jgi:hypothetical protein
MATRRYLLMLDMDLLALDEELDREPVNYLVARQEQERAEVVVLAVVASRPVKPSPLELLLGVLPPPTASLPRPSTPRRPSRAAMSMPPSTARTWRCGT